ncbi:MAG: sigma-70 family RNA polymerase sigma factor [Oscillospiraceae bacterium]|nr:sigma-70 family RNA polymerase sigma factor [Oscillospiraceae bacterium]
MSRVEDLIAQCQAGDMQAKETLILENNGLIWSVTKRFLGRGAEAEDMYQLACLGFLKAVDGFDLNYGTQFSTYAVPKIAGEIRRFLRDDGAVKVSRTIKERAAVIKAARNHLVNTLEHEPTVNEISEYTGISSEDIAIAESACFNVESIQEATGEDGFTLENILTDTKSEEMILEQFALNQAIERLSKRESMVIKLRYFHGLTQQRIAIILGVSQVQVSRIEKKALERLRELLL